MPDSDEESLGFEDLGDDDESSLESSLASCQEEQPTSHSGDFESIVRERRSLDSLGADSSVESPLPSDSECCGSQRVVTFEDLGFSLNSSCEVNYLPPDFATERGLQLVQITEHSRGMTYISIDSKDSGDEEEFGSSSDFGVLHLLPQPSTTKNQMLKVLLMPGSTSTSAAPEVDERSCSNLGADAINFDKQFDILHIACPI